MLNDLYDYLHEKLYHKRKINKLKSFILILKKIHA